MHEDVVEERDREREGCAGGEGFGVQRSEASRRKERKTLPFVHLSAIINIFWGFFFFL